MRSKKPSGRPHKGPFTAGDLCGALETDGWFDEGPGGNHAAVYAHPTKPGKIPIKKAWTGLRIGCPILNGIQRTAELSKGRLLKLLNDAR